jgi:hypothetical protein
MLNNIFLTALRPLWALASFQFPDLFTIGRIPWTSNQLVARPLPKHRAAQTQNKHIYTPNIHALSGIRTHDYGVRVSEDNSYLRPLIYRGRPSITFIFSYLRRHNYKKRLWETVLFTNPSASSQTILAAEVHLAERNLLLKKQALNMEVSDIACRNSRPRVFKRQGQNLQPRQTLISFLTFHSSFIHQWLYSP